MLGCQGRPWANRLQCLCDGDFSQSRRKPVQQVKRMFCVFKWGSPTSSSLVVQSCPTLCDPVDCSLPGASVQEILQARILEWVAISSSRGSSRPRDQTHISCIGRRILTTEPHGEPTHTPNHIRQTAGGELLYSRGSLAWSSADLVGDGAGGGREPVHAPTAGSC